MPKASGQNLKVTRVAPRPSPVAREIKRFAAPARGPHHNPPAATPPPASNEIAAHAVRVASSPGGIDPKMMHY